MNPCKSNHLLTDMMSPEDALLLDNQVCFPLYSAANAVVRAYRPLLNELDLTYVQYLAMMVLWQTNGLNVKTLGKKLNLDSGTLTPLLKRLEAKGLVTRKVSPNDERVKELFLTPRGIELKEKARSVPSAMCCKIRLELEELLTLKALCEKIIHTLD